MSNISFENIAVLVPAYKPDASLMLPFLTKLKQKFDTVIVVDDGGGVKFENVFIACRELGAKVLTHEFNMGKGTALKTGIAYISGRCPTVEGIVTADCDGQHLVEDIEKVASALCENPDKLIIGGRRFDKDVPLRSQAGNTFTRQMFRLATGVKIYDTQTGLRAFGRGLFDEMLELKGSRYEYEMNMLLKLKEWDVEPYEVTIKTVYINENATSHYDTVRDSIRIGSRILLFLSASIASFIVDYALYLWFTALKFPPGIPFLAARAISSVVNYLLNRNVVFNSKNAKHSTLKYFALATVVMLLGTGVTFAADIFLDGGWLLAVKIVYDIIMYFINYIIQRDFVFRSEKKREK